MKPAAKVSPGAAPCMRSSLKNLVANLKTVYDVFALFFSVEKVFNNLATLDII